PALADWCFVEVKDDDGRIRLLTAGHSDPEMVEMAVDSLRRHPIDPDAPHGTARVLRTGEPEVMLEIPPGFDDLMAQDDDHREVLRRVGFRSYISVPLSAAGRTFGVLSLVQAESGRLFTADDVPLATELAHRAAVAIENARLYQEALAANRAKDGFLATMSHELRTPLNAMIGYVDLLLMGIPEPIPVSAQAKVERIRLATRHLLSIIEEILTFSRIQAGRETPEMEEVDLAALASEVSAIIEPLAREKGLLFHVPADIDPPTLRTDPRKLRQILVNLLGNAVKFTRGGSVGFAVERGEGAVLLHVSDTGVGVAPEHQELIFEPFRQVDDTKTRTVAGTGLGLTVSRELARLLGGDVTVASTRGEGSVFTVRLPDAQGTADRG
ncbi:MAG TPA: ATP-binding protein, partial [Longimicrobiaceae bacterium]